jgi:UDP-2,3-diacylglucosamine hydrolase
VLPGPCYLFADAHLGVASRDTERSVARFVRSLHGRAASVIINGDLFDFWFEWRTVMPRAGFRVLSALSDLVDAGIPVLWIAGNHDCWGGDVLRKDVGVTYHEGPWRGEIAGWRTRIEHGDGLRNAEDRRYRALRAVLRHPWSIRAFRLLHPDLGARIALGSSHASRTYRARDGGAGLRAVALRGLAQDPDLDLVVFGHSHVATVERADGGGVYANAGAWLDAPTYLRIDRDAIALAMFDAAGDDRVVHSVLAEDARRDSAARRALPAD